MPHPVPITDGEDWANDHAPDGTLPLIVLPFVIAYLAGLLGGACLIITWGFV